MGFFSNIKKAWTKVKGAIAGPGTQVTPTKLTPDLFGVPSAASPGSIPGVTPTISTPQTAALTGGPSSGTGVAPIVGSGSMDAAELAQSRRTAENVRTAEAARVAEVEAQKQAAETQKAQGLRTGMASLMTPQTEAQQAISLQNVRRELEGTVATGEPSKIASIAAQDYLKIGAMLLIGLGLIFSLTGGQLIMRLINW